MIPIPRVRATVTADYTRIVEYKHLPGNGNSSPTLEMSVEPAVVAVNGSATVTWKTRGVRICTASGDWSGNQQKSGSRTFDNITAARTWELTCNGKGTEISRSVAVTVAGGNNPPVADAGPDRRVSTGDFVELDAGASSDADGDALSFAWTVMSRPAGSSAILFNAATRNPRILADVAGRSTTAPTTAAPTPSRSSPRTRRR